MYDSPIRLAVSKMASQFNDDIYNAVVKTGIDVDKDELVRALNYDRNQYEKGYRDGLKASKWISVKERLPDESGDYLTFRKSGICAVLGYSAKYHAFNSSDNLPTSSLKYRIKVTHWMPLPSTEGLHD